MDKKQKQSLNVLAKELCRLDYDEIQARIELLETDALIELLNARSRKVGDSAFYCLAGRPDGEDSVIEAVLKDRLTRKDSRVRAANFLHFRGCTHASAMRAYFHLLDNKDEDSAASALFWLCLLTEQGPPFVIAPKAKRTSAWQQVTE